MIFFLSQVCTTKPGRGCKHVFNVMGWARASDKKRQGLVVRDGVDAGAIRPVVLATVSVDDVSATTAAPVVESLRAAVPNLGAVFGDTGCSCLRTAVAVPAVKVNTKEGKKTGGAGNSVLC